jgi:hypothetical protein
MKIWIPIAIAVIVVLAVAGLLPLPGQKDNVTPHSQPGAPQVEAPTGPPPSPPSQAGAGATVPPPGGNPALPPGGPSSSTSDHTVTGEAGTRGAETGSAR